MMKQFQATSHKPHVTRPTNIFILCLVSGVWSLVSGLCFAQEHPLSYYEVIEKRNFFRPKEKIQPNGTQGKISNENTKKQNKSLGFILTGVVRIRGKYKAIIEKPSGEGFYVGINESVEDYLVKKINTDTVVLEKDNKESVLKLKKAKSKDDTGSKKENKKGLPQKENNQANKTGYAPNILKELRTGRKPAQTMGGKR